jgi:hypothetical protein
MDDLKANERADFKLKANLEKRQLEKLIVFSNEYTTIKNSSIQDVTDALNAMIYDCEFKAMSGLRFYLERCENYFGIDIMSFFFLTQSVSRPCYALNAPLILVSSSVCWNRLCFNSCFEIQVIKLENAFTNTSDPRISRRLVQKLYLVE